MQLLDLNAMRLNALKCIIIPKVPATWILEYHYIFILISAIFQGVTKLSESIVCYLNSFMGINWYHGKFNMGNSWKTYQNYLQISQQNST